MITRQILVFLRQLLVFLKILFNIDNIDRTKHVEIDRYFIMEKVDTVLICMPFVPTSQQVDDILTKGLFRHSFEIFLSWA